MQWWRRQSGDTLVEVVFSIAIFGVVLAMAYTMGNFSLRNGIDAREHAEAVYVAQQQAERLMAKREEAIADTTCTSAAGINSIFSTPACGYTLNSPYCINAASAAETADCNFGEDSRYAVRVYSSEPQDGLLSTTIDVKWGSIIGDTDSPDHQASEHITLMQIDDRNIPVRNCDVVGQPACR